VLHPRCVNVLGSGMVIDPRALIEEIDRLTAAGLLS
jgi:adenylosuccinate synthase